MNIEGVDKVGFAGNTGHYRSVWGATIYIDRNLRDIKVVKELEVPEIKTVSKSEFYQTLYTQRSEKLNDVLKEIKLLKSQLDICQKTLERVTKIVV